MNNLFFVLSFQLSRLQQYQVLRQKVWILFLVSSLPFQPMSIFLLTAGLIVLPFLTDFLTRTLPFFINIENLVRLIFILFETVSKVFKSFGNCYLVKFQSPNSRCCFWKTNGQKSSVVNPNNRLFIKFMYVTNYASCILKEVVLKILIPKNTQ